MRRIGVVVAFVLTNNGYKLGVPAALSQEASLRHPLCRGLGKLELQLGYGG